MSRGNRTGHDTAALPLAAAFVLARELCRDTQVSA
jgi:hypothetical protein